MIELQGMRREKGSREAGRRDRMCLPMSLSGEDLSFSLVRVLTSEFYPSNFVSFHTSLKADAACVKRINPK